MTDDPTPTLADIVARLQLDVATLIQSVDVEHARCAELVNACRAQRDVLRALLAWKHRHGPNCLQEGLLETRQARVAELQVFSANREAADARMLRALNALVDDDAAPPVVTRPALVTSH